MNTIFPHDTDAEIQVLGSILKSDEMEDTVFYNLSLDDFYSIGAKKVYEAIMELKKQNNPVDTFTVTNYLQEKIGIPETQAISQFLFGEYHSFEVAEYFLNKLKQKAYERKLILLGEQIKKLGQWNDTHKEKDKQKNETTLQLEAENLFRQLEVGRIEQDEYTSNQLFLEIKREIPEELVFLPGITTGFPSLDLFTGGFQKSNLIVIAGRPGMGKTALAVNSILLASDHRKEDDGYFIFYSLEQSIQQIAFRCLTILDNNTTLLDLKRGNLSVEKRKQIMTLADKLRKLPVIWYNPKNRDYNYFESKIRRKVRDNKILGIYIDHLGEFFLPGYERNKYAEVSEIITRLQSFCRELDIPIVTLMQLSRKVEDRQDKKPTMADLRESGRIEESAWVVLLLYRDEYYKKEKSEKPGILTVIADKNRDGETGTVELNFNKKSLRIFEQSKEEGQYEYPY